jgi:hypothetical protein
MPKFARFFSCVPNKKSTISIYICLELRNKQQEQTPKKVQKSQENLFLLLVYIKSISTTFCLSLETSHY